MGLHIVGDKGKRRCETKHLLVGADGSDASTAALGWTGRRARLLDAEVVVASIFRPDQVEMTPEHHDLAVVTHLPAMQRLPGWGAPHKFST